ncbi:MAG: hypothetical protein V1706_00265 [Pseudomonadota bacterium]
MENNTGIKGKSAFELFPDIMKTIPQSRKGDAEKRETAVAGKGGARPAVSRVEPPGPPDISKFLSGEKERLARDAEVSVALLLMKDEKERATVENVLAELGYLVECVDTQVEAVEKMGFVNAGAVILQDGFEGKEFGRSLFHQYMKSLPMAKRRSLYYVLVGPRLYTLYDLQALAESANLVVNVRHVDKFDMILRKGLRQYEELFGPFVELLSAQGRK